MARKVHYRLPHRFLLFTLLVSLFFNGIFAIHNWEDDIVTSVPDGDSLQLADGRRIRLLSIDAPERNACMGMEARLALEERALGRHVRLKEVVTDDFGRQLALVLIDEPFSRLQLSYYSYWIRDRLGLSPAPFPDLMLNRHLLRHGLARYTSSASGEYADFLKQARDRARAEGLGIWSPACRNTVAPDQDCVIKGNNRHGDLTYHLPDCHNYTQTIIDEAFGDAWFCTEDEAIASGFIRATGCPQP